MQKVFSPPSIADVLSYCNQRRNGIDAEAFVAFYASKGWKVGNQPMKDWRQAVITWERRRAADLNTRKETSYDLTVFESLIIGGHSRV